MGFLIGFLLLIVVIVVAVVIVIAYVSYLILCGIGLAVLVVVGLLVFGIHEAITAGDFSILGLALFLSVLLYPFCRKIYRSLTEDSRKEAERIKLEKEQQRVAEEMAKAQKHFEEEQLRVEEEQQRARNAMRLAKAGPIETWLRDLIKF